MKRSILTSTGTMVSRHNGYDYRRALREAALLREDGLTDGIELMMLVFYYDKYRDVIQTIRENGLTAPVIHCEKEIGTMLSDWGKAIAQHDPTAGDLREKADQLFRLNCAIGALAGSERMVLHLWGGLSSDFFIDGNISVLPLYREVAAEHGLRLLIENIPSAGDDPLTNWRRILDKNALGDGGFIYDTRFGQLHEQHDAIFADRRVTEHIEHVHISDFGGTYRNFKALRPILHPGEGTVDFPHIGDLLNSIHYTGTITLESPVNVEADLDIPKLRRTLTYLNQLFN